VRQRRLTISVPWAEDGALQEKQKSQTSGLRSSDCNYIIANSGGICPAFANFISSFLSGDYKQLLRFAILTTGTYHDRVRGTSNSKLTAFFVRDLRNNDELFPVARAANRCRGLSQAGLIGYSNRRKLLLPGVEAPRKTSLLQRNSAGT
jgi:hypothetical protein